MASCAIIILVYPIHMHVSLIYDQQSIELWRLLSITMVRSSCAMKMREVKEQTISPNYIQSFLWGITIHPVHRRIYAALGGKS